MIIRCHCGWRGFVAGNIKGSISLQAFEAIGATDGEGLLPSYMEAHGPPVATFIGELS